MERTVETTQSGQFSLDSERIYAKRHLTPRNYHYGADGIPRSFDIHTATVTLTHPAVKLLRVIDEKELINSKSVVTNPT